MEERRPNPDALLTRVLAQENKTHRGRLRLFFGMAAGVGKTCEMLKAAQERQREGVDVWVGLVETHGRVETEKLLNGLPVVPRHKQEYRGTLQEEMDLDAILCKKPQLVLVDELAHTNVPGSRHEKRYQDVIELLDAGIDVYSTMNVQHLESRADIVRLITAVDVRETVPDSVLDLVDQIDLIDLTPHELMARLKEGKIYPGKKTEQALQYFFQEGNLSALREIALRVTANKVERDLKDLRNPSLRNTSAVEKLLVAISHSAFSEKLIRTARRIVEGLEMPWVVVYVDTGKVLSAKDQNQLVKNIELARNMGAEAVTLHSAQVAEALTEYVQNHNIIQMIVGRPARLKPFWNPFSSSGFIEKLIRNNPDIDILVLHQPHEEKKNKEPEGASVPERSWPSYAKAVGSVLTAAAMNYAINPYLGYKAVGFLFLFVVVAVSVWLPFRAVLLAATLSALAWDYFFIAPKGTFSVNASEDIME